MTSETKRDRIKPSSYKRVEKFKEVCADRDRWRSLAEELGERLDEIRDAEAEINEEEIAKANRKYSIKADFIIGGNFRKNAAYHNAGYTLEKLAKLKEESR